MAVESGTYSPEVIARRAKMAEALLKANPKPIEHWAQGLNELAQGALGGYQLKRSETMESEGRKAAMAQVLAAMGGGGEQAPAAVPMGGGVPPTAAPATTASGDPASVIAGIESGGRYDAIGPTTRGDRPYGKYQVMGANVPAWTKAHLGQEMTPQQFLASPEAQDAVFRGQFGQYSQKYGPEGAAKAWFAGEGGMNNPNARDVLGTTVASYADKFNKGMGAGGIPGVAAALQGAAAPTPPPQPAAGIPAVAGALQAPTQVAQNAPAATGGPNREAVVRAMMNPWTPPGMGSMLASQLNEKATYQTDADGNIIKLDPYGRNPPTVVYKAAVKPITVKEDDRLYDPASKTFLGGNAPAPTTVPGPDGKPIPIPPGLSGKDTREFTRHVTTTTADAATGKKTEVQAKDEKFANKMELAEKVLSQVGDDQGTSTRGRMLDATIPFTNTKMIPGSNYMQSDKYQQYRQAQDNFITALLRDESGAAINNPEFTRYEKEMFPQPGDGAGVIAQKREARRIAIEAMKKGAGPGYKSPTAALGAPDGVDPKVWDAMTPQERALWK